MANPEKFEEEKPSLEEVRESLLFQIQQRSVDGSSAESIKEIEEQLKKVEEDIALEKGEK